MRVLLCALGLLVLGQAAAQGPTAAADADLVDFLPGYGPLENATLAMYSGYLQVNRNPLREIFYVHTESERNPEQDPLILWLQGGPSCSSLGIGFFQEIGPFSFDSRRNISRTFLVKNNLSWSKFASLLFLDTPAFTGFSRSSATQTDRSWGDGNTTADNMLALRSFYTRFPEMRKRPLFLAGQAYAGHFVPLLARSIVEYNTLYLPKGEEPMPLKGIMVGNPWTEPQLDNGGAVAFWYSQGIISRDTYDGLKEQCNPQTTVLWLTQGLGSGAAPGNVTGECAKFRAAMLRETSTLDMFGLNGGRCVMEPGFVPPGDKGVLPLEGDEASLEEGLPRAFQPRPVSGSLPNPFFDPCASYRAWDYLNDPEVQEALHAIQPNEEGREFRSCNPDAISYSLADMLTSMVPVYRTLLNSSVPILVYSGTTDAVIPTVSTRTWVESLKLAPVGRFGPVKDGAGETLGLTQEYQGGLTFTTLLEAGQSAPAFKPARTLNLAKTFVAKHASKPTPQAPTAAPAKAPAQAQPSPAKAPAPAPKAQPQVQAPTAQPQV